MMKYRFLTALLIAAFGFSQVAEARKLEGEGPGSGKRGGGGSPGTAANCAPPSTASELAINNVRALIQTGGDMWWDLVGQPRYEIPSGSGRTALFAGSLWLGGQDVSGQLKVAAQRFRSNGNDFWTGPLSTIDAEISPGTCADYDEHYRTLRDGVSEFRAWFQCNSDPDCNTQTTFPGYQVPDYILNWPAHGRNFAPYNEDYYLAPFFDNDGNGDYNPLDGGDYPRYDLDGQTDCGQRIVDIYGDENLWWVFNDKGNIHTETGSEAIGMEIRAQAFGFATNDEVNNMTFYNYELVNRSSFQLANTYFGFWVDADLGFAQDDYVGCDVERGLGYAYNGDENDEDGGGAIGYGTTPPAIGVDFFQGPFQDNDTKDNCLCLNDFNGAIADDGIPYAGLGVGYGDSIVDNERLGMRAFLYHNNDQSNTGDPVAGPEYYNYLRSFWKDNSHMVYGGTGFRGSVSPPYIEADFMFPADSDPIGWGTYGDPQPEWTEVTAGNPPADRRFVQSSGPFTLAPGAVNNITVGVVWSRAITGGANASVQKLLVDDQKTQALFDACFQLLDGPDAPSVEVVELDKELILLIDNVTTSNNYQEAYAEVDPFIVAPDSLSPAEQIAYKTYRFQGYQVFQLKDASVSASDIYDDTKARLIFQSDVKDSIADLTNYIFNQELGAEEALPRVTNAANDGIKKSIRITSDVFAEGNNTLVNHKTYYFMVISYAHNSFKEYRQNDPEFLDGQKTPYLPSRKAATGPIPVTSGIPHITDQKNNGTVLNASYGDGVRITKIEGLGNSGRNLELTQESVDAIMAGEPWVASPLTYEAGAGPIEVKVIDPLNIRPGNYRLRFIDSTNLADMDDATWELIDVATDEVLATSTSTINLGTEDIIPDLGISITALNVPEAGRISTAVNNGLIGSSIEFADINNPWLTGVSDADGSIVENWIRSGNTRDENDPTFNDYDMSSEIAIDPNENFENVAGGTWAPFRLAGTYTHQPAVNYPGLTHVDLFQGLPTQVDFRGYQLSYLNNVNVYITSDQSKWSRVPVIEASDDSSLAVNGAPKMTLRRSPSVDKDGNPSAVSTPSTDPNDPNYISGTGMGWFPGYAIDIETGERLNMAFSEDSYLFSENGADMLWNPTEILKDGAFGTDIRFGGKHFIYVFRNNIIEDEAHQFPFDFNDIDNRMPTYDAGQFLREKLALVTGASGTRNEYRRAWRACTWVGYPMLELNAELLSTDVTIKLRVNNAFQPYAVGDVLSVGDAPTVGVEYLVQQGPIAYNGVEYNRGETFVAEAAGGPILSTADTDNDTIDNAVATTNGGRPLYEFSLNGLEPTTNVLTVAEDALDIINVVPNPYYAYSTYETGKVDTRVKLVNLPERCNIKIYTMSGVLVREFSKDDPNTTSIDWDLKNHARIPIAGGVYLIHVDVPGVGERVIKWFGVMRPVDLDSF